MSRWQKTKKLLVAAVLVWIFAATAQAQTKSLVECLKYGKFGFVGKSINLNFEETELQKILAEVTRQTGCEFGVDKSVGNPIFSINVSGMPWNEAVKSLISFDNLDIQPNGPMLRVASVDVLKTEADSPKTKGISATAVRTEIIVLKKDLYPNALDRDELGKLIAEQLSESGSFEIDDKSNALKLVDLEKNLMAVRKLITKLYVKLVSSKDKTVKELALN